MSLIKLIVSEAIAGVGEKPTLYLVLRISGGSMSQITLAANLPSVSVISTCSLNPLALSYSI